MFFYFAVSSHDHSNCSSSHQVYEARLQKLKKQSLDLRFRLREYTERPKAIEMLRNSLNLSRTFLVQINNITDKDEIYTAKDLEELGKIINDTTVRCIIIVFVCSVVRSFARSSVRPSVRPSILSVVRWFVGSLVRWFVGSFSPSLLAPFLFPSFLIFFVTRCLTSYTSILSYLNESFIPALYTSLLNLWNPQLRSCPRFKLVIDVWAHRSIESLPFYIPTV